MHSLPDDEKNELSKLSDEDYCVLLHLYDVTNLTISSEAITAITHLIHQHNMVEAADLAAALLRFVVVAGAKEAALFAKYGVDHPKHYDNVDDRTTLAEVEKALAGMHIASAMTEGENSVKH